MDRFIVFKPAFLFKAPDLTSERLGTVQRDTEFEGVEQDDGFVKASIPSVSPQEGFVLRAGFVMKALSAPLPFAAEDASALCALLTRAARDASTDRDYLMAVAYVLSENLTKVASADGASVGPFRYGESDWKAAITTGAAKDRGLQPSDRFRWYRQPTVAAQIAADDARKLREALGQAPKFNELFFYQRLGAETGLRALKERDKKCSEFITDAAAGSYAAELKAGVMTVTEALAKLQKDLDEAYVEALKVIEAQPPEIRFFRAASGDAPWMAVAREQMKAGVSEDAGHRNTDQIKAYFTDVGSQDDSGTTPWCGAFVGFCMKHCGVAEVSKTVKPAAVGTDFWEGWGTPAADPPPVGTVVVLRPGGSGGHVGFLAEGSTPQMTKLLGGNQGGGGGQNPDRVGIVDFPTATNPIVALRTMATAPAIQTAERRAGDDLFVQKAPVVMQQLMSALPQLADFHAAAILGNIGQECGGFTQLRQLGMPEGKGGFGWCQWDDRGPTFLKFAQDMGLTFRDDEANLKFLIHELQTSENPAFKLLLKESNLEDAVVTFNDKFERSGKPMMDNRIRFARLALQCFQKV